MSKFLACLFLMLLGPFATVFAQGDLHPSREEVGVEKTSLPLIVKFNGLLRGLSDGLPLTDLVGVTFALYKSETGGAPLWLETQNVDLDAAGEFTVLLGSAHSGGIPVDLFASGEARWLGMSTDDGVERPRILLVSVPYALKAADADTLGGKHPEEFMLAQQFESLSKGAIVSASCRAPVDAAMLNCTPPSPLPPISWSTSQTRAPRFEATSSVGPSFISDATSGPPLQVRSSVLISNLNADFLHGLTVLDFARPKVSNQFAPVQRFNGGISLEGPVPTGSVSQASPPLDFKARTYQRSVQTFRDQVFRWKAEPLESGNGGPGARLSLLFGANGKAPSETGFSLNPDGTLNFATNQQIPTNAVVTALNSATNQPGSATLPVVYSTAYEWQQASIKGSIHPGRNVIRMPKCPAGVTGSEDDFSVYISGTGIPEAVAVTGGTCNGDGQPGTLEFTAVNAHPAGYIISSATSGLQEATIAARFTPTNPTGIPQSGSVVVPPGEYKAYAPIAIRGSNMTVDFSGSIIECHMDASCIFVGDPLNSSQFENITLVNPRGRPMVPNGTKPFIEVNAQQTRIMNVATRVSPLPNTFGTYVQVDNDQAFLLNGLDATLGSGGVRCDSVFCGSYVTAPGPFSRWAAVGWLSNLNLSMQCRGNGIDWQSGNTLRVSDSVIQGYAQFGIRGGAIRGGNGGFELSNVYEEVGQLLKPFWPDRRGRCDRPGGLGEDNRWHRPTRHASSLCQYRFDRLSVLHRGS